MALKTGTLTLTDLKSERFQSVVAVGTDRVEDAIKRDFGVHNRMLNAALAQVAQDTEDRQLVSGGSASIEMVPSDEFTRAPTQKVRTGQTVGFPLEGYQAAIGWTQEFLEKPGSASEIATQVLAAQTAHKRKVMADLKRAIYMPTNYTFYDYLTTPQIALAVKRFLNAESGTQIPDGPNGETWPDTHTHFTAEASLSASGLKASINTVAEHNSGASMRTVIARADEDTVRALTGFRAYTEVGLVHGNTDGTPIKLLDPTNPGDRAIGLFNGSEVWVKPWGIANYAYSQDMAAPERPIVRRLPVGITGDLRVIAENNAFPLIARFLKAQFGFGAWGRSAGAVHYFAGGTYAAPTING